MTEDLKKLFTLREDGICENCGYGFDNCLKDGKPFCENYEPKKEDENEQEKSV